MTPFRVTVAVVVVLVSTEARTTAKGQAIPARDPFHDRDDVESGPIRRLFR